jgi:CDP-alcohol phosphatidyltransferase
MLTRAVFPRRSLSLYRFHRLSVIPRRPLRVARAYYATEKEHSQSSKTPTRRENIYTLPNLLTTSRIIACPVLGWSIIQGNFPLATGLLIYAGISDLVRLSSLRGLLGTDLSSQLDGYIARRYNSGTVIGSILDPAADKALMTTLVVSLAYKGMLPCEFTSFNARTTHSCILHHLSTTCCCCPWAGRPPEYFSILLPMDIVAPTGMQITRIIPWILA